MKTIELLGELCKYPLNTEVQFEAKMTIHTCDGGPCYCTDRPIRFKIETIDKETLSKNGRKKLKFPIVALRGEEVYGD